MSKKKPIQDDIVKLSPYRHARLRTEMYFGSRVTHNQEVLIYDKNYNPQKTSLTWVPALYTAFREILDNALDEVVGHGYGSSIWVSYNEKDKIFTVEDDGRGIPIDLDKNENIHKATLALSQIMTGRNFAERNEVAGTNGVGAACTNFCSEWFTLDIHRDNKHFHQEFTQGDVLFDSLVIKSPKIKTVKNVKTGTKINFKLSSTVFPEMILPEEFIKSRIIEIALCNPNIKVFYNSKLIKVSKKPEQTLFNSKSIITLDISTAEFKSKFFIHPNWHNESQFSHSIVNNIPAFNGGAHITAFERNFSKNLLQALERESKRRKLSPNNSDLQHGLLIYNITTMKAPNFDSQSKTRLINESAGKLVQEFLNNPEIYKTIIKKNRSWIDEIYQRCADRTQRKDQGDIDKLSKRLAKAKVAKLLDANGRDRSKCILALTEGESAKLGFAAARDPNIHAALDLRGKVMNVYSLSPKEVLMNSELQDIINAVGLQINQKVDRRNLRYGQIWLSHDMDPDGFNIGALLINFFYKFWPELFDVNDKPFIHIFQTPYIIAKKGKDRKYWYGHNYDEFDADKLKGYQITRAKGLSALEDLDWDYALLHPELIPIVDDGKMTETLSLIFDKSKANERKEWMGI